MASQSKASTSTPKLNCIVHISTVSEKEKSVAPVDIESWKRLLDAAEIRKYKPLQDLAKEFTDKIPPVTYHAVCRSRFVMKRDLNALKCESKHNDDEDDDDNHEPLPKRISSRRECSTSPVYEKKCIFKGFICKSNSKYIRGTHTREKLSPCLELKADKRLRVLAQKRMHSNIIAVTSHEIVAAEAHYHPSCYKEFTREDVYIPKKLVIDDDGDGNDYTKYSNAEKEAYVQPFFHIRNTLFENPAIVKLSTLTKQLVTTMQSSGIADIKESTKKHIRRKLECEFGDSLVFASCPKKVLVCPATLSLQHLIQENNRLQEELEMLHSNVRSDESAAIKTAMSLHGTVAEYEKQTTQQWPPNPDTTDNEHIYIPQLLETFLQVLLTGKNGKVSDRVNLIVKSIGQDIIYTVSRGQLKLPKHILLSYAVKSLTGNVETIKCLNRLGHSISYTHMTEIDTALCLKKMANMPGVGVPLPESVEPEFHTTLAFDNIDRVEETLSGSGTSHRVNGIIIQPKVHGPKFPVKPVENTPKGKQRTLLHFVDDQHLPPYIAGEKTCPPICNRQYVEDYANEEAWKKTFMWFLCRLHSSQEVPSWTGYNIKVKENFDIYAENLGYLPTINAPATNMSTVLEILNQSANIIEELYLDSIICVFDQALYAKAAEIKWKYPERFGKIILRLGAFHTTCTLLAIIGKRFRDAGLRDLCIEANIIAEGSISSVLDGKMYNRGIRTHKLIYEALLKLAWKSFKPWIECNHPDHVFLFDNISDVVSDVNGSIPCDPTTCQCARNGLLCTDMCKHPDTCTNKQSDIDDNFPNIPNDDDYDDGDEEF